MEKYIIIPTTDGFEIRGILNWKEISDRVVVFVHGLTGYPQEAHYVGAKNYFVSRGYDVFRFHLYHGGEKNRKLATCSIDDHARDIESVLKYLSDEYKSIYLIGHSLGGPSIVRMNTHIDKISSIVFWDPAFDARKYGVGFEKKGNIFLFDGRDGRKIQVSESIAEQRSENHMDMLSIFSKKISQIGIIFAGKNSKIDFKPQTDAMGIKSCIIEGANHGFTQEGKFEELFEKTLEFIQA